MIFSSGYRYLEETLSPVLVSLTPPEDPGMILSMAVKSVSSPEIGRTEMNYDYAFLPDTQRLTQYLRLLKGNHQLSTSCSNANYGTLASSLEQDIGQSTLLV